MGSGICAVYTPTALDSSDLRFDFTLMLLRTASGEGGQDNGRGGVYSLALVRGFCGRVDDMQQTLTTTLPEQYSHKLANVLFGQSRPTPDCVWCLVRRDEAQSFFSRMGTASLLLQQRSKGLNKRSIHVVADARVLPDYFCER